MTWIYPKAQVIAKLPVGRVRTNTSDEDTKKKAKAEGKRRRQTRWYYSESGKAWRKKYREKRRKWEQENSEKIYARHKQWREENLERYRLYQRLYYQTNEKRREYLRVKCREYRLRKKMGDASSDTRAKERASADAR